MQALLIDCGEHDKLCKTWGLDIGGLAGGQRRPSVPVLTLLLLFCSCWSHRPSSPCFLLQLNRCHFVVKGRQLMMSPRPDWKWLSLEVFQLERHEDQILKTWLPHNVQCSQISYLSYFHIKSRKPWFLICPVHKVSQPSARAPLNWSPSRSAVCTARFRLSLIQWGVHNLNTSLNDLRVLMVAVWMGGSVLECHMAELPGCFPSFSLCQK